MAKLAQRSTKRLLNDLENARRRGEEARAKELETILAKRALQPKQEAA